MRILKNEASDEVGEATTTDAQTADLTQVPYRRAS